MALDAAKLLAMEPIDTRQALSRKDTILYALGVGANELAYVYEEQLNPLPTIATILGHPGFFWRDPSFGVDWRRIVHGGVGIEIHAPLPVEGEIVGLTSFGPIVDKGSGKGAIVHQTRRIFCEGVHVATVRSASVLRGDGGFGGTSDAAPPQQPIPERDPDRTCALPTSPNQALLYRLSGDPNPLHIVPEVAREAGFERPILHGLASFGFAGRALIAEFAGGKADAIRSMEARFSAPVFPGETIRTEIWELNPGAAAFRAVAEERGATIMNNGLVRLKVAEDE